MVNNARAGYSFKGAPASFKSPLRACAVTVVVPVHGRVVGDNVLRPTALVDDVRELQRAT